MFRSVSVFWEWIVKFRIQIWFIVNVGIFVEIFEEGSGMISDSGRMNFDIFCDKLKKGQYWRGGLQEVVQVSRILIYSRRRGNNYLLRRYYMLGLV